MPPGMHPVMASSLILYQRERDSGETKNRLAAVFVITVQVACQRRLLVNPTDSALTRLEAWVRLADHKDLATAADHLAVAMTGLCRLQGGKDFHDIPREDSGWK
jgi:hypothetical protein